MKFDEKIRAISLREQGLSINDIALQLKVAKSSVSIWVRNTQLSKLQSDTLAAKSFSRDAIERRRISRLANEEVKRSALITEARKEIQRVNNSEMWLMGVMLYWAEGGKTQRMVRFSNGDPEMIKIMMHFFRVICKVTEEKFRGYIHIHPHLDFESAESYWSTVSKIPKTQFFKTYRIQNKSSQNKKDTLPNGVMDIYVLDTKLFLRITGWAQGIFASY